MRTMFKKEAARMFPFSREAKKIDAVAFLECGKSLPILSPIFH